MVINEKKCAIQLNPETDLPESLHGIPRLVGTSFKYLGFEMKNGGVDMKCMMAKLEGRIREKPEERTMRVGDFESRNQTQSINQNVIISSDSTVGMTS